MSAIQWKIITKIEGINYHIKLEVHDKNLEPLSHFFRSSVESYYPSLIKNALQGGGYGFNAEGVIFPNDLDEYDLTQYEPIEPDMVEIYDPIARIQIPQTTFLQVLLEVAEATLAVRQELLGNASKEWDEQMKKAISDLRLRLS